MRSLFFCISLLAVTGCATSAPPADIPRPTQVQSDALKSGECGLFGWSTDEKREFIFYADPKEARYAAANGPVALTAVGSFPSLRYTDPEGQPVELRLGASEAMDGGVRYPASRIVSLTAEGWERVSPVAIVQTCQAK